MFLKPSHRGRNEKRHTFPNYVWCPPRIQEPKFMVGFKIKYCDECCPTNYSEELWKEDYKFILNIAGEIDTQNKSHINKKDFEYLIRNENISFLGKCNNMPEIYKNMDIVVLPSWREGLSKIIFLDFWLL